MDVVVLLWRVHPVLFEIVDKEVNVFRHEVWLDWRKIDPGDLSIGVFVADCNKTGMLVSRGSLSAPFFFLFPIQGEHLQRAVSRDPQTTRNEWSPSMRLVRSRALTIQQDVGCRTDRGEENNAEGASGVSHLG